MNKNFRISNFNSNHKPRNILNPILSSETLSPELQKKGMTLFSWFIRINTISFGCLADSILILYAIKMGADDFLIGLMTSFMFLTMPFMFIGKQMIGRFGAANAYGISWIIRNIFAGLMVLVPVTISLWDRTIGLTLLIFCSFGFFAFRSIGFTSSTPLIGEVTNKTNRGNFLSKIWLQFNIFYFITLLALMIILKYSGSMQTFQFIILAGFIFGMIGSVLVYHIPETMNPKISARSSTSKSFSYLWRNIRCRKLLFSWTGVMMANMLLIPFSMVALKNGYGVSDHNALFFALFQILGGIFASSLNILILDRVGPKPMLILYSFGFIVNALLWVFSPQQLITSYQAVIFLINGMTLAGTNTAISHYFLIVIPEKERVGTNMFYLIISGTVTGITGIILGGGLLKLLQNFDLSNLSIYRTFFVIILFFLLPLIYIIQKIERVEDWRVKDVLKIFMSFRDLRALFTLNRIEKK